jgi:hypothetical protein
MLSRKHEMLNAASLKILIMASHEQQGNRNPVLAMEILIQASYLSELAVVAFLPVLQSS